MDYYQKGQGWFAKLKAKKCSDLEGLVVSENSCLHMDNGRIIQPDCVYCRLQRKGKEDIEFSWEKADEQTVGPKVQFVIKKQSKLICILGKEEAYGFGFGTKEDEGIMLYLRIGPAAVLMYSNSDSGAVSAMFGVESENPEKLDGLVKFMKIGKENSEDGDNKKESGCC